MAEDRAAESHAHPVDRGQQRLVEPLDDLEQVLEARPAAGPPSPVAMAAISWRSWPAVKAVPRPGQHHGVDVVVTEGAGEGRRHGPVHGRVEGVAHLGTVEGEEADPVEVLDARSGGVDGRGHGRNT